MRQKTFVLIMMLITFGTIEIYAQTDWILDNSNNHISTSVIDSITYTKEGVNHYIQNLWNNGQIIEKEIIEDGYSLEPKEVKLGYDFCTFEEDGFDGVLTNTGNYAILQYTPDSTGYFLTIGTNDDDSYSCMSFDTLGFVTGFKTSDNRTFQAIYSPNEIWLLDSDGVIVTEIPYTIFVAEEDNLKVRSKAPRRESYTRTPLYNGLSIFNTIGGYLNNYKQAAGLDLLHSLLKGAGNRYGDLLGKLIKAGFDPKNPLSWLDVLDAANDISFFGNASIIALDAIKKDVCSFTTPCKVEGLTYNTDVFRNMRARYEELMDYKYTLNMSVQTATIPHKEKQTKSMKIERDGTYNFNFDFKELQTLYDYEPSLTLDLTIKKYVSPQQIKELRNAVLAINPDATFDNITEPIWYTMNNSCTIQGNPNSLVTGSVSSTIEKVNNISTTTADIICSFSTVPSGANCVIFISREGSDIGLTFSGTPGKSSQSIKATGLSVNTTYVATTYITYNGRTYDGIKSISFTTKGPSGSVISVDDVTDKSAVAKCRFGGIESDVECGVICKSSNQLLTFPASGKEGEQSITMSGLTPNTSYQCYAYVRTSNHYQEEEGVSFTTSPPDISGTWTCTEEYYNAWDRNYEHPQYKNYSITLNKNGTASINNGSSYESAAWSFDGTTLRIAVSIMNTISYNGGCDYVGTVDNPDNPTSFRGAINNWSFNNVVGYVARGGNSFVLSR